MASKFLKPQFSSELLFESVGLFTWVFGARGPVGRGKSPHSVRVSSRCNNYPLNNEARQSDKHRGLEYLSKIETLLNDAC